MSDRDYYETLGVMPGADRQMIDQAYWHLARKYQTQGATDTRARHLLDELNEAYGVLGTPRLREQYDAFRDDVLIRSGVLQPVTSKPRHRKKRALPGEQPPRPSRQLPDLRLADWRWYGLATIVAALAFAGAWQGVNPVLVLVGLGAGLALSLTPVLRRQINDVSLPSISMPELRAPRIPVPSIPDVNVQKMLERGLGQERGEPVDPDVLAASTSALIARWRQSVGLRTFDYGPRPDESATEEPSATLVEIVEAERSLRQQAADVSPVVDALRVTRPDAG